jgi:hypothetical protein
MIDQVGNYSACLFLVIQNLLSSFQGKKVACSLQELAQNQPFICGFLWGI